MTVRRYTAESGLSVGSVVLTTTALCCLISYDWQSVDSDQQDVVFHQENAASHSAHQNMQKIADMAESCRDIRHTARLIFSCLGL